MKHATTHAERRSIKKRNWLIIKSIFSILTFALITNSVMSLDYIDNIEIILCYSLWALMTIVIFLGDV